MNIPDKIKIGGKTYTVEITDKLNCGSINYTGEICYRELAIRICPQKQQKMEADLLHEIIHGILNHLGYFDQDEKKVDELANALYMVIQDNPSMFSKLDWSEEE